MAKFTPVQLKEMVKETLKKGSIQFILDKVLDLLSVPSRRSYCRVQVYKHPSNHIMDEIEADDMITGFTDEGKFVTAVFIGGDSDNWSNYQILSDLKK